MEAVLSKDAALFSIEFLKPELQAKVLKSIVLTRFFKNDPLNFIEFPKKHACEKTAVLYASYKEFSRLTFQK